MPESDMSESEQGDGSLLYSTTLPGETKEEKGVRNGRSLHQGAISRVQSLFDKLLGKYQLPRICVSTL